MIRVLLADDHAVLRQGLRMLLEQQDDIEVVAEAATGLETIRKTRETEPDVVLMDIAMPDLNGVEATRRIVQSWPKTRVVMLSMHADARYVKESLVAGASGYIVKHAAFDEVVLAVRAAAAGHVYLSPMVAGVVAEHFRGSAHPEDDPVAGLTPREREVLQLLAEGHSAQDIARLLHLSVKTVETHRHHLMEKLGVRSVAELTKIAVRAGLTQL